MVRYLTEDDVKQLIFMPQALDAVESAWKARSLGQASDIPRTRAQVPEGILNMLKATAPSLGYIGFKYYYNAKAGDTKHIHLVNVKTGRLEAIIEAGWLGSMRTGAASGIATRYLAKKKSETLGQIGSGGQASTQISAIHHAVGVSKVKVFSRTRSKLVAFCNAMSSELNIEVMPADSAEGALQGADVVNVMTRSATPVMNGAWLEPGQHINAAGSNALNRQEVDQQSIERCDVITVDARGTAENESGDLAPLVERGKLRWKDLTEIGDVITAKAVGRSDDRQISLFESHGMGLQDLYIAVEALRMAREKKIGIDLPINS
jgi:ornithine cyclodeaminase/alanine dehydrogenase-like protein (mu-crystallin family)